jgi:hypothetical protein
MYNISDTLTFPVGNVRLNQSSVPNNLVLTANDFYCSGILGYTAFLIGSVNKYTTKVALDKETLNENIDFLKYNSMRQKSVTGGPWAEAIEYKEENAFALCLPEKPNKYAAERKDYTSIVELINKTIDESYHTVLLNRFIAAYPDKKDKVVCILPKHMIQLTSLGSFKGSAEDYADVKEVVCALTYIAVGTEMSNKCAITVAAGGLLIDWKIKEKDEDGEWPFYRKFRANLVRAYLRAQDYIEDAMSLIIQEYTGEVNREELSKYDVSNYRGAAVSNFSLGITEEHINFNDFSFLNALSIVKSWEERRGVDLELDNLKEDYYEARRKAPHIPDHF